MHIPFIFPSWVVRVERIHGMFSELWYWNSISIARLPRVQLCSRGARMQGTTHRLEGLSRPVVFGTTENRWVKTAKEWSLQGSSTDLYLTWKFQRMTRPERCDQAGQNGRSSVPVQPPAVRACVSGNAPASLQALAELLAHPVIGSRRSTAKRTWRAILASPPLQHPTRRCTPKTWVLDRFRAWKELVTVMVIELSFFYWISYATNHHVHTHDTVNVLNNLLCRCYTR